MYDIILYLSWLKHSGWVENCLLQTDMTDWLRGQKLDIPEFYSKNMKLTDLNEWFFISLPLLKLLADVYAPVHD